MANTSIRNLLSLIQKRFVNTSATAASTTSSSSSSFTFQYLTDSCGLPLQSALSFSKKFQLNQKNLSNPQSVLDLLKSYDFDNSHVAKLIEKRPGVLVSKLDSNLRPKFDFFRENGFVGHLLPELIISNPAVLSSSLDSQIKPSLDLLKSVLDSNEKIVAVIKRSSWLLTFDLKGVMQPNIDFLIKEGVPVNSIAKLISLHPRVITQKHDRMIYAVNAIKNLGRKPETVTFIHALRVMIQMSESTWKKKIEMMKSLGWSEEDIWRAYKHDPFWLACSEEKLRIGMDFYVNTMKLGLQTIIKRPRFLMFSLDKRIRPRYNVLKVLESQKLIQGECKMVQSLTVTEEDFLKTYVIKYADKVPGLLEIYRDTNMVKKMHTT